MPPTGMEGVVDEDGVEVEACVQAPEVGAMVYVVDPLVWEMARVATRLEEQVAVSDPSLFVFATERP